MRNIRIDIEYDGTPYAGWQRQPGGISTVQGEIEAVLKRILQEGVELVAAGRTDRGVHARGQVANFRSASPMELGRLAYAANSLLPATIRLTGMEEVAESFHARFSARERRYRYVLLERPSALMERFSGCAGGRVELGAMQAAADMLLGQHSFSGFSKQDRDGGGSLCTVRSARWHRRGECLIFQISANRFLRSMVRGLVASMVAVGRGWEEPERFRARLACQSGLPPLALAEPQGLFLWKVLY